MYVRKDAGIYQFQKKGYVVINDFMPETHRDPVVQDFLHTSGEKDEQCPVSQSFSKHPKCEFLLLYFQKFVEEVNSLPLYPTYSYARLYKPGEVLTPHTDRPSCEISVTINMGQSSEEFNWPIFFALYKETPSVVSVNLNPGDAIVYRGCELPHWREEFKPPSADDWQAQLFLHYVNVYGPNTHHIYDGRDNLEVENFLENI